MVKQNGFPKREKLKSSTAIAEVFKARNVIYEYPLRLHFSKLPCGGPPVKLCVSLSKKLFKRASDRNRIKRQLREIYRLNKNIFEIPENESYGLVFCYGSKEKMKYEVLETAFKEIAGRLNHKIK